MKQVILITTVDRIEVNPTKKTRNYINDCLNALFRPNAEDFEVIVFDSGSASIDFIRETDNYHLLTKVVESKEKLSLIRNTNRALKYASEKYNTDWVLLLQDDVFTQENTLLKLPKLLEVAPKDAGMLTFSCAKWSSFNFCRKNINKFVSYPPSNWYVIWFAAFKRALIKDWLASQLCADGLKKNVGIDCFIGLWFAVASKVYAYDPRLAINYGHVSANTASESWRKKNG